MGIPAIRFGEAIKVHYQLNEAPIKPLSVSNSQEILSAKRQISEKLDQWGIRAEFTQVGSAAECDEYLVFDGEQDTLSQLEAIRGMKPGRASQLQELKDEYSKATDAQTREKLMEQYKKLRDEPGSFHPRKILDKADLTKSGKLMENPAAHFTFRMEQGDRATIIPNIDELKEFVLEAVLAVIKLPPFTR